MRNFHTPVQKFPPPGKEYICFRKYGKIDHAAQCAKSHVLNKVIDTIPDIDSFEH